MRYYPVFLDLIEQQVLVVGAGKVGLRKLRTLLDCPLKSLHVLDVAPCPQHLLADVQAGKITFWQKTFSANDVQGKKLVFAATGNSAVNAFVGDVCKTQGIFCNIADAPENSNFFVPAHISNGPITIALGTDGASPALAKHLRKELEDWLGNRYTALEILMGRLRPALLELHKPTEENAHVFRALIQSSLARELASRDFPLATNTLTQILPEELHGRIGDLIHDL